LLLFRLILALYLLASGLARFDFTTMPRWEVFVRLALAVVIMHSNPYIFLPAMAVGMLWILWRYMRKRPPSEPVPA